MSPIVVSDEIDWASRWSKAEATDTADIVQKIGWALGPARDYLVGANRRGLRKVCEQARREWLRLA